MSGGRKEAAVRLLEAENRAQPTEAAMFRSITRLEVFFGKDLDRVVFRFLSTRHTLGDSESAVEDAGDGHARQRMS
jgi:hypothetical protein